MPKNYLLLMLVLMSSCKKMEDPDANIVPPLTDEQVEVVKSFDAETVSTIDEVLDKKINHRWQKTAMVVAQTMIELDAKYENIPMAYYILRLEKFHEDGKIEIQGTLNKMRFSEVRRNK